MSDFFLFEIFDLICNLIGGSIRWIFGTIWRTIFSKPKFKYSEYLFGVKDSKNHFDIHGHQFNNIIVTILFVVILINILL